LVISAKAADYHLQIGIKIMTTEPIIETILTISQKNKRGHALTSGQSWISHLK
jgi:hypothetical protein